MPRMTEELSRIASGIAASRRQRAEDATVRAGVVSERHNEVGALLRGMTTARERMGRQQRREAAVALRGRCQEVKTLLGHCQRAMSARHRQRLEQAAAQRAQAAAFMRELTTGVAALRDAFGVDQAARASSCRELARTVRRQLTEYGRDRHAAIAAWGGASTAKPASAPALPARNDPAQVRSEETPTQPVMQGYSTPAPAPAAEPAARAGRHRSGHATSSENESSP